jgi:hypothetical protein
MAIRPDLARQNIPTSVAAILCYRILSDPTAWHTCLVGASRTAIVATTIRACLAGVALLPRSGHSRAREMESNRMLRMETQNMAMLPMAINARRRIVPGRHKLPSRLRAVTMKLHDLIGVPKEAKQTAGSVPESALRIWENEPGKTA